MNRGKSYRMFVALLFFAFISFISRSMIYLIVSLIVAFLLFILLSKDMKEKKERKEETRVYQVSKGNSNLKHKSNYQYVFPIFFVFSGTMMITYGYTGFYRADGIFYKLGWMVKEPFILIFFVIFGAILVLYGMTTVLKNWLRK